MCLIHRRPSRAFTLIELLVVVAIIGILLALLLPTLAGVRTQAKRVTCAAQLKQVGVGLLSYLQESNDILPYSSFMPSVDPFPIQEEEPIFLADLLVPHLNGSAEVLHCPNDQDGVIQRPEPNVGKTYFDSERSSYVFRFGLGGQQTTQISSIYERYRDEKVADNLIWLMRDYDNFHGEAGSQGARRYLYLDGHVTDFEY